MSFQLIRSHIETRIQAAYQVQRVQVVWDNVQETPPALPYVICLISFQETTEAVLCTGESMMENINGSIQLSHYAPRGQGMKQLETLAATGMSCLNTMYDWGNTTANVKMGRINGPVHLLEGPEPYAISTLSAPFTAIVY